MLLLPLSSEARELVKRATAGPVDITADSLEYNKKEAMYTAKGHVIIKEGIRTLTADYAEYHEDTADALAEGNVVLEDSEGVIRTQRMTLNLVTQQGTIEKGDIYIKQGNFYLIGDEIKKTGESTYLIRQGKFTTCGWDKPAWTFAAKDINVKAEGYATANSAKFSILDHPVFFTPWGVFPVKTERQSGFLLPELVKSSRDGFRLTESYFWAISRDTDATFGLQYIQDRGPRPMVEYRYFISPSFRGQWAASIIDDTMFKHTRWNIVGEHTQAINDSLTLKAKVYQVSDQDYLKDFGITTLQRSENSVKSTVFAEQLLTKSMLTAETTYFRTLAQESNNQTFQYLPFVSFFTEYVPLLRDKFYTNVSSDIANFYREQGSSYSRFAAQPAAHVPFHFEGLNFLASSTLIERLYSINQQGIVPGAPVDSEQKSSDHFQTVMIEGDANFQAYRNYKTDFLGLGDLQSVIKPRVGYTFIPATNTVDLPNVDPSDQTVHTNTVTYSFNHYLNATSGNSSREISLLEIDQTYGLSGDLAPSPAYVLGNGSTTTGRRFSDIHARLTFYPSTAFLFAEEAYIDPYDTQAKILRTTVGYTRPKFTTTVSHNYQQSAINQVLWITAGTYNDFDGRVAIRYDLIENSWIDTLYAITYHPGCWSITLSLVQTRRPPDTAIHFSFNLAGLTTSRNQPALPGVPLTPPSPTTGTSTKGANGLQNGWQNSIF